MQQAVREINADQTLSREEKFRRIQALHLQQHSAFVAAQQSKQTEATAKPCVHYQRHCDIETPCCNKWYSCRLCHDESESHVLDRYSTTLMKCRECHLVQPVSSCCATKECAWKNTMYYCERCRLWEDDPKKHIFHCDGCGICRVGKREAFWHCDNCRLCLSNGIIKEEHHCVKGAADDVCVCGEYMQTSTKSVSILPCGHTMHQECSTKMMQSNHVTCPKCRKSIFRDREFERALKREIRLFPMPEQYRRKCQVLCNDCDEKTITNYHWIGVQCKQKRCGSFNTAVVETLPPDETETFVDDSAEGDVSETLQEGDDDKQEDELDEEEIEGNRQNNAEDDLDLD